MQRFPGTIGGAAALICLVGIPWMLGTLFGAPVVVGYFVAIAVIANMHVERDQLRRECAWCREHIELLQASRLGRADEMHIIEHRNRDPRAARR